MNTKRRVFYSFHYSNDNWRAAQVRNIGAVEGNRPATDNDWEKVKQGGQRAIREWIAKQMKGRSCTVVLVGSHTANRKWINYEIIESWDKKMGVVGIYIHGLKDRSDRTSTKGDNPFDHIKFNDGKKLSSIVKCYDPGGHNSTSKYDWISSNLSEIIEEAISIRNSS